jgi:Raf kinase inhibitor-like YbhB/YbcL family protein
MIAIKKLFILFISGFATYVFSMVCFAEEMTLNTNAFLDTGALPVLYTCDGKNISPELSWANAPAKTVNFALTLVDKEALSGKFYHWLIFNIPKTTTTLTEGIAKLPAGALIAKNSFANLGYNGPCPPHGTAHTYIFTLYALDTKLAIPGGATSDELSKALSNHIIAKATLTAVYSRWFK